MKRGKIANSWKTLVLIILGTVLLAAPVGLFAADEPKAAQPKSKAPNAPAGSTRTETRQKIIGSSLLVGRALYFYEELGTNGKSCKSCHKEGQSTDGKPWKRKDGDTYMDGKMSLAKAINHCIANRQGGVALTGSVEMKSLLVYVTSLQK